MGSDAWTIRAGQALGTSLRGATPAVGLGVCSDLFTHIISDFAAYEDCFEVRNCTSENAIGSKSEAQNLNPIPGKQGRNSLRACMNEDFFSVIAKYFCRLL